MTIFNVLVITCSYILLDHSPCFALLGRASGDLYEDDGDGFGFQTGDYLLTHYKAEKELSSSAKGVEVVIRVASVEGHRARPERMLHVRLLIGKDVQVHHETVKLRFYYKSHNLLFC